MRLLDYASSSPWALLPEKGPELAAIAERLHETSPEVLEAYRADALQHAEQARVRDGIAVLDVQGPLFKKANLFVRISGATSYEILRKDLQAALDNDQVDSIILKIDSPGGEANGCDELATAIYEARGVKPIVAYVSGMAASGAYWIAAAADRIVVSDAALLGSIGVVLGVRPKGADDKTIEFVSSQSPGKRPDVGTDVGRSQIQTMVDDLAEVFVSAVARYRGVTVEDVIANFGAGGVKIGAKAVAAGMADEVGQLEALLTSMQVSRPPAVTTVKAVAGLTQVGDRGTVPIAAEDPTKRIKAILTHQAAKVLPSLASILAFEMDLPAKMSLSIISAARADFDKLAAAAPPVVSQAEMARRYLDEQRAAGALGLVPLNAS